MEEIYSKRFASIIETFYLSENLADFHFLIKRNDGEFERIPAHKLLLTASNVFRTMFNGDWKEKAEVEISDASPVDFKEFLKTFYFIQVNPTTENVGFVMNLANKYDVPECLAVCSKFLTDSVTNDNVCSAYGLATFFDQGKLKKYCELVIGTNTKAVLSSNTFFECDRNMLKRILDLDFISCSEVDVFGACMNWVKFKSGQEHLTREIVEAQLGEERPFAEFRFKSMSPLQLAMLSSSYGKLFTVDELIDIPQLVGLDTFKSNFFSEKQRKSIDNLIHDGNEIYCNRLISKWHSSEPYKIKEVEVTTFSVSEPVLLENITCSVVKHVKNIFCNLKENLATDLEIVQISGESDEQILCEQKAQFECAAYNVITLLKPVLIRPNLMHEIRFKQSPPADVVVSTMVKPEVKVNSNLTVKFHRDEFVDGDWAARGMVYRLLFKKI